MVRMEGMMIVQAQLQGLETVVPAEHVQVVAQTHKAADPQVVPVIEAKLHHLEKGQVGKDEQEQQRGDQENHGADELLSPHGLAFLDKSQLRLFRHSLMITHGLPPFLFLTRFGRNLSARGPGSGPLARA